MHQVLGPCCSPIVNGTGTVLVQWVYGDSTGWYVGTSSMAVLTAPSCPYKSSSTVPQPGRFEVVKSKSKSKSHPSPSAKLIPQLMGHAGCSEAYVAHSDEQGTQQTLCLHSIITPLQCWLQTCPCAPLPPPPSSHIMHQKQFPMNTE